MNDETAPRARGPAAWQLLLATVLLYVLSIGPAVMVTERFSMPEEPVRAFYLPVVWLHNHTPLQRPLEWYAALWGWN